RVFAHHFVQRPMEQVCDGVVALDGLAARAVHGEKHGVSGYGEHNGISRSAARFCSGSATVPVAPLRLSRSGTRRRDAEESGRDARAPLFNEVQPGVAGLLGVADAPKLAAVLQLPRVTDLTAHLCVTRGGVEHHGRLVLESYHY